MPTLQELESARNNAQTTSANAGQFAAGSYNVESELRKKLEDAYNANQDIVKPLDESTQSYLAAPAEGREKYQDIFNPFQRENLVSQFQGNKAIPMLSYSNLYGSRVGSIADQMSAGTGAYNAQTALAQNQAQQAQQLYQNLFGEYDADRKFALEQQKASQTDGGIGDILSTVKTLEGFGPNSSQQSEAKKADSVLKSIQTISDADKGALGRAALIAKGGVPGFFAKIGATPEEQSLADAMVNLLNVLRLEYTGAAFSPKEEETYRLLTSDPVRAYSDPNSLVSSLQTLQPFFQEISNLGQNPYQGYINAIKPVLDAQFGIGSQSTVDIDSLMSEYGL